MIIPRLCRKRSHSSGGSVAKISVVRIFWRRVSTPLEISREVPDEKSLLGGVSVISRGVDRGSCFSAAGRGVVAASQLVC
jgi:hypothetical protein